MFGMTYTEMFGRVNELRQRLARVRQVCGVVDLERELWTLTDKAHIRRYRIDGGPFTAYVKLDLATGDTSVYSSVDRFSELRRNDSIARNTYYESAYRDETAAQLEARRVFRQAWEDWRDGKRQAMPDSDFTLPDGQREGY